MLWCIVYSTAYDHAVVMLLGITFNLDFIINLPIGVYATYKCMNVGLLCMEYIPLGPVKP